VAIRHFLVILIALTFIPITTAQEPTYWKDIRPILRKHCTSCHSAKHLKELDVSGGLALDSFEAFIKSPAKATVRIGKSSDSLLIHLLVSADENKRMPLGGSPLSGEKIALIRRWIDDGAREGLKENIAEAVPVAMASPTRKLPVLLRTTTDLPKKAGGPGAKLELTMKVGPLAPVVAVAFSPDGKWLATGCYGQVTVWDLETVRPVKVLTNVLGAVNDVRFSPKGELLAVAGGQPSAKGDLRLYRVADWSLLTVLRGHEDVVFSVAFDPAGVRLASASFDKTVRLWNLVSKKAERVLDGHSDFVYSVAFGPDGKWLASSSKDRSVRITDVSTGKSLFTLGGVEQDVLAVAVSPDGKSVVSSGFETGIRWWDARTGERKKIQPGHGIAVHELAFSKDGKELVSAGADGTVRLWDADGSPRKALPVGSMVYAVAVSPDGSRVASGSFDGFVRLWDAKSGKLLLTLLSLPSQGERFDWLAMTPEGYAEGSDGVRAQGQWRTGNLVGVEAWKLLHRPELVLRSFQGQPVPVPRFGEN
jgi:WD40 repeat protein